ncbi:esterase E4-like [Bacillus rossius redtenbacheri]|uniref:esterase E4-like n=1 Tax=Bacillus rossius redtenbacheri TaxID=93214 RepID=UPI002FDE6829
MNTTQMTAAAALLALLAAAAAAAGGGVKGRPARQFPVVATSQGQLRGSVMRSRQGKDIYAFRGVRFAEPPLGELRFKAPVPVAAWSGVRNATEDGSACPQPVADYPVPMSEDCLFLNVYTTKLPHGRSNPRRPVVVFFNPGGFYGFTGHSAILGPQYLLDHELILVTNNYRLGALGLLSTGDGVLPGNYAMKDQVAVLRWVRQNIGAFGGDPDSVTIAGYSAGSMSVMFHMVSPMSRGLFHRAIAMSGSPFFKWSVDRDPLPVARKLARHFRCPVDSSEAIRSCLLRVDALEMGRAIDIYREFAWDPIVSFMPTLERAGDSEEQFLTVEPQQSLLSGDFVHVPLITGMTQDEFAWRSLDVLKNATWKDEINNNYYEVYPIAFMYERGTERSRYITDELRNFYLKNKDVENTPRNGLGTLYSDALVGFGVHRTSKVLPCVNSQPVYYYKFSFPGRYSYVYLENTTTPFGVVHHDETLYLFYISVLAPFFTENDPEVLMVKRLTQLWANFIQTGNPTPNRTELFNNVLWEPITTTNSKYLDEGTVMEMKEGLFQERLALWDRLFPLQMPKCYAH